MSRNTERIQVNVDKKVAREAEDVIAELRLTPTAVINALYKEIVTTGAIPFDCKLSPKELAEIKLHQATERAPIGKIKIINLDHMVITVNNLEKSKKFYNEIIGLPVKSDETDKNHVSLICGNSLLRLRQADNKVKAIVANKMVPGSFDFCLESSDDINNIIDYLKKNQIKIELGPVVKHGFKGKMISIYFRDPDNNLVEICNYNS